MATQPEPQIPPEVPMPVEPNPDPAPEPGTTPETAIEIGGRSGPDPVRYGDWEKGGVAVDF